MSQLPSQPNSSQLSFPAQPLQPIGQGMDSAVLSLTHSPAPRSLTIDSGPQVCLPNVCVVCCIAEETWTRFLIWWFGEFGLITNLKTHQLSTRVYGFRSSNSNFANTNGEPFLPNLMLAKITHCYGIGSTVLLTVCILFILPCMHVQEILRICSAHHLWDSGSCRPEAYKILPIDITKGVWDSLDIYMLPSVHAVVVLCVCYCTNCYIYTSFESPKCDL